MKSTMTSARSARPISSLLPLIGGEVHRRGQEAALVADHPHLDAGDMVEVQDQEARLAAVQEAEAVAALLDCQERPGVAVHHDACCRRTRGSRSARDRYPGCMAPDPVEERARVRVEERAIGVERTILDGDRDLVIGLVGRELVVLLGRRAGQHRRRAAAASSTASSPSGPPRMM